jgi:hypothetical protein
MFACKLYFTGYEPREFTLFSNRNSASDSQYNSDNLTELSGLGYEITELTSNFFPNERMYVRVRFREYGGCDPASAHAGEMSTAELLSVGNAGVREVDDDQDIVNRICTRPSPAFSLKDPNSPLEIECEYDQLHWF